MLAQKLLTLLFEPEYIINYADGTSVTVYDKKFTKWWYRDLKKLKNIIERTWKYEADANGYSMSFHSYDRIIKGE